LQQLPLCHLPTTTVAITIMSKLFEALSKRVLAQASTQSCEANKLLLQGIGKHLENVPRRMAQLKPEAQALCARVRSGDMTLREFTRGLFTVTLQAAGFFMVGVAVGRGGFFTFSS
jgi:hypothetical protein